MTAKESAFNELMEKAEKAAVLNPNGNDKTLCLLEAALPRFTDVQATIHSFQSFCESAEFPLHLSQQAGFKNPVFRKNTYEGSLALKKEEGSPALKKFNEGFASLEQTAVFGLVFHGTRPHNLPNILRCGLNPERRTGQAYGPGEYFSKEPGVSVSYCKGGLEMLVFLVVIPVDNVNKNCPPDYVVVNNNHLQLPLGTITYTGIDAAVRLASEQRRNKFRDLRTQLKEHADFAKQAMIKANIIQKMIENKCDVASELYQRHKSTLNVVSEREIALYVHRFLDKDVISYLFPDLLSPLSISEFDKTAITSVEVAKEGLMKKYEELEAEELAASAAQKRKLESYESALSNTSKQSEVIKGTIIQHMIANRNDVASEVYQQHMNTLNATSKREIAMYVHRFLDKDVISFMFPDLPGSVNE